ncbi:hypothetical protein H6G04_30680 [Calothrix membranacea FACHB-236]|nr:hypothetical protein [Calothrix membranacea FACHB-236]
MTPPIDMKFSEGIWQHLQQAKYFVDDSVNSLTNSAQQAGQSLKETANQATDRAINTVTTTWEQAKGSVEQSLQTAEQVKSTTSTAVQTAIASSMNDWLAQHPAIFRLVQMLSWAANHPIISCIMLVFILALLWSIIRAIMRLIETASWSILRVPIKLLQALAKVIFISFATFGSFAVQKIKGTQAKDKTSAIVPVNSEIIYQSKQQRLAEISTRLEAIQKEQQELLREAASLIADDNSVTIEEWKLNGHQKYTSI